MSEHNGHGNGRPDGPPNPNRPGGGPPKRRPRPGGRPGGPRRSPPSPIGLRQVEGGVFELVHPKCVEEVDLDYREGLEIWKNGEPEEARDALRFALEGCGDNLWVHVALGDLALKEFRDPRLARGHYGYAFELGHRALPPDFAGKLPRERSANRPFHDALQGLCACLRAEGEHREADRLAKLQERLR